MLPYLRKGFGNPSSLHEFGQMARRAVAGEPTVPSVRPLFPADRHTANPYFWIASSTNWAEWR